MLMRLAIVLVALAATSARGDSLRPIEVGATVGAHAFSSEYHCIGRKLATSTPASRMGAKYSSFSFAAPKASRRKRTFTPARARSMRICCTVSASWPGLA